MILKKSFSQYFFLILALAGILHTSIVYSQESESSLEQEVVEEVSEPEPEVVSEPEPEREVEQEVEPEPTPEPEEIIIEEESEIVADLSETTETVVVDLYEETDPATDQVADIPETENPTEEVEPQLTIEPNEESEIVVDLSDTTEAVVTDLYEDEAATTTDQVAIPETGTSTEEIEPESPIESVAGIVEDILDGLFGEGGDSATTTEEVEIETDDDSMISINLDTLTTATSTAITGFFDDLFEYATSSSSTVATTTEELLEELLEEEPEVDDVPEITAEEIAAHEAYIASLPKVPAETHHNNNQDFYGRTFSECDSEIPEVKVGGFFGDDSFKLSADNSDVTIKIGDTPVGITVDQIKEEQKTGSTVVTFGIEKDGLAQQGVFSVPLVVAKSGNKDLSLCSVLIINE